jgi:predicted acylesterase/phospholipase RssA
VAALARHLDGGAWSDADRAAILSAASGYTDLLRSHIMKEDQILYPMAQARLPDAVMEQVDRDCASFEARQGTAGADALRELARDLAQRGGCARRLPGMDAPRGATDDPRGRPGHRRGAGPERRPGRGE